MKGPHKGGGNALPLVLLVVIIEATWASNYEHEDLYSGAVQPWEEALQHVRPKSTPEEQEAAVKGLIQRLLPDRADEFSVSVNSSLGPDGKDTFLIVSPGVNASVDLQGTSGVAAAWGLLHYLKYTCNAHVSWEADQLSLPKPLPPANINVTSNDRFRYYQNVCTVSYSMAWWNWTRWEREIDWMALNGINIPLAFTGQEAIWHRVYTKLNLTQQELDEHFVGPAFLAWGRMGNIRGWGGPLTASWHNQTLALQHQILQRMRELGIMPILPAFAGHVPAGLSRVFPDANITRLDSWGNFNCTYSCTYLLDPNDPLFKKIGADFVNEMTAEFGTDHLYNCDTFNEMTPKSSDPDYLRSVGAAVFAAMTEADPDAIWVMQGWLFYNAESFWQKPQAEALLTSVPIGRMLVLDLASEVAPQYSRLESYFGQPFIFCMLHDYGGVDGFFGNIDVLIKNMADARTFPNVTLVGTGLTPEGINQNYVMYDFMNEFAWRTTAPDVNEWAASYAIRRYDSEDERLGYAWQLLMGSIYNCKVILRYHGRNVVIMQRPKLKPRHLIWYSVDAVVEAWDLFIDVIEDTEAVGGDKSPREVGGQDERARSSSSNEDESDEDESDEEEEEEEELAHEPLLSSLAASLGNPSEQQLIKSGDAGVKLQSSADIGTTSVLHGSSIKRMVDHDLSDRSGQERSQVTLPVASQATFLHDVVDMTRQILQILGGEIALRMIDSYHNGDIIGVKGHHETIQMILQDMDTILATSPDFLLGAWTESAAAWATDEKERELYVYNALNQVTLWGPSGEILDYALKQWSGLVSNYVAQRWVVFGDQLVQSLESGKPFDEGSFLSYIFENVEQPMSLDVNATYPAQPTGDTIATALLLHGKYRPFFNETVRASWKKESQHLQQQQLPEQIHQPTALDHKTWKKKKQELVKQQHKVNKFLREEDNEAESREFLERLEKERLENSIWRYLH